MSGQPQPGYRFVTEAQWRACHFVGADRLSAGGRTSLQPFAPFDLPPVALGSEAAFAPAISPASELFWRDDKGGLLRLRYAEETADRSEAAAEISAATRMIAEPEMLWVVDDAGIVAFDIQTLAPSMRVDLGGLVPVDIASDGSGGVWALARTGENSQLVHLNCGGSADIVIALDAPRASAVVSLAVVNALVVFDAGSAKLLFIDLASGLPRRDIPLSALRGCFEVTAFGGDGCSRFFIAGNDGGAAGGGHRLLILDGDGVLLGTLPLDARPTGITASRAQLFVSTEAGMRRFSRTTLVPRGAGEVIARAVTPLLRSPATGEQTWLRVEAKADLPPGCSLQISCATTSSAEACARAAEALADPALSPPQQLEEWGRHVELRTVAYHGDDEATGDILLSAPLQNVRDERLWVAVTLIAGPGGRLPTLSELKILYPGPTLIEHLPAIYRRGESETGDFTRSLLGLLEAGTQDLDQQIAALGSLINPATADPSWLDYVAGWLGLPWDNGLAVEQKRRLLGRASQIAEAYSTRSGLETLLDCLLPDSPRRFRVVDTTAEFGIATLGGGEIEGSRFPAVLAGLPGYAAELGNKAILGKARLACGKPESASARLIGHVRVDIAATEEERRAWSPWLGAMIQAMLPATVTARLRWLPPREGRGNLLHDELRLAGSPGARLGSDVVTGIARLGGRVRTVLPARLEPEPRLQ